YIRYQNGKEELYQTNQDFHEWNNLAGEQEHATVRNRFRKQLDQTLASSAPPTTAKRAPVKKWNWHAAVDKSKDGKVTLKEWLAWSVEADKKKGTTFDEKKRTGTFHWFDKNKDGHLSPTELK
ncbi:MAG: hypothetical protein ACPGVU_27155, partial [Limisphaerales bacterium]